MSCEMEAKVSVRCDIRCSHCNKLLCKGCVEWLEIKCPRCGTVENIKISSNNSPYEKLESTKIQFNTDKKA